MVGHRKKMKKNLFENVAAATRTLRNYWIEKKFEKKKKNEKKKNLLLPPKRCAAALKSPRPNAKLLNRKKKKKKKVEKIFWFEKKFFAPAIKSPIKLKKKIKKTWNFFFDAAPKTLCRNAAIKLPRHKAKLFSISKKPWHFSHALSLKIKQKTDFAKVH